MMLKDKTVIVSGVGPGMGQALARLAAREGARVVLAARNVAFLETVLAEIRSAGAEAIAVPCDVTDTDQCHALAQATREAFGDKVHGLINSAYYHGEWSFVENADSGDFARAYDVNCLGALRLTQACLPMLKGGGAIVNVSTIGTVKPHGADHGMEMGYAIAKGGLNVLTKYMAADLGRHGIRVNACRMGWIYGAPVRSYIDAMVAQGQREEDVVGTVTANIPLGVIPPEDDCARAVLMMLSDYAAVVTGAVLDVNGGQWMAP
ncbi:NAD(P)-dependent dehydrogenase (short-subunit alcohol dehydrogenase family) [Sphingobium sp. OAS761]|uniref:SDR family oxidoreductase n=1 Tax=Sphingobium sp. OAS761 TaxID=2817901 RepID=UPI0020A04324|nr:SDR family oxidoreductase [Sphingobium sp. OAS761]MCP1470399.1 NAD(P)-dependent dehydrogenase (short-subunit alcohol dehydrogenase family) [Sphingobium sp. OAS761]